MTDPHSTSRQRYAVVTISTTVRLPRSTVVVVVDISVSRTQTTRSLYHTMVSS